MKAKAKREGPLKIPLSFDEAIGRALHVKPPAGGWGALANSGSTHKRRRRHKTAVK